MDEFGGHSWAMLIGAMIGILLILVLVMASMIGTI